MCVMCLLSLSSVLVVVLLVFGVVILCVCLSVIVF